MFFCDDDPGFDVLEPFPTPSFIRKVPGAVEVADIIRSLLTERQDGLGCRPTRTSSTLSDYEDVARSLVRQAGSPWALEAEERLMWTIIWCSQQCGHWRSATFRRYRAALLWAVERLAEAGQLGLAEVKRCLDALKCAPDPRPARAAPQTSARKRHSVTLNEIEILVGALSNARTETHRLLRGLLVYGVHFGLRPSEFLHATVRDRQLLVRCAKATNGRAVGASRAILLNGFGPRELRTLAAFFVLLRRAAAAAPSCSAFFDRLRQALRRLCLAHDIEPICLYTLRHQGIANAKVHLGRRALAAYAGHASQQTASRGYARARAGWRTELLCGPDPDTVIAVRPLPQRRFGGAEASPEPSPLAHAFTDEPPPLGLGLEGEAPRPPEAAGVPMRAEVPEGDEPMADDPGPYGM